MSTEQDGKETPIASSEETPHPEKGSAPPESTSGGSGGWGIVGGIIGVIVFFAFFKKTPTGPFSDFGKPTLFFIGGAVLFTLLGKLFSSSR